MVRWVSCPLTGDNQSPILSCLQSHCSSLFPTCHAPIQPWAGRTWIRVAKKNLVAESTVPEHLLADLERT